MDLKKQQIQTDDDFKMAMSSVQSACQLLAMFDWQHLIEQTNFFEGAGAIINPSVFLAMQKDPQWEQKKQLFNAAAKFVREVEDIKRQLGHED